MEVVYWWWAFVGTRGRSLRQAQGDVVSRGASFVGRGYYDWLFECLFSQFQMGTQKDNVLW